MTQTTKVITQVHKCGDHQTEEYAVGKYGVASIERFEIKGAMDFFPRLRIIFENGHTVEIDEGGMTIYETEVPHV